MVTIFGVEPLGMALWVQTSLMLLVSCLSLISVGLLMSRHMNILFYSDSVREPFLSFNKTCYAASTIKGPFLSSSYSRLMQVAKIFEDDSENADLMHLWNQDDFEGVWEIEKLYGSGDTYA